MLVQGSPPPGEEEKSCNIKTGGVGNNFGGEEICLCVVREAAGQVTQRFGLDGQSLAVSVFIHSFITPNISINISNISHLFFAVLQVIWGFYLKKLMRTITASFLGAAS